MVPSKITEYFFPFFSSTPSSLPSFLPKSPPHIQTHICADTKSSWFVYFKHFYLPFRFKYPFWTCTSKYYTHICILCVYYTHTYICMCIWILFCIYPKHHVFLMVYYWVNFYVLRKYFFGMWMHNLDLSFFSVSGTWIFFFFFC